MSNTFGHLVRLTTFGESHGVAVGGVLDGYPSGVDVDMDFVQTRLDRRRPGQSGLTSQRREADRVEFLSGLFEGKTTGAPIAFLVRNTDMRSEDYDHLRHVFRPSHADFTYAAKYGLRDHRGGGRSSARETVARVVAGALAEYYLLQQGIDIRTWTQQVGDIACSLEWASLDLDLIHHNAVRCPDPIRAREMEALIQQVRSEGDSIGSAVACVIQGCPVGLGEPLYDKLQAALASAMMSIGAARGFEYGDGFTAITQRGSQHNDPFVLTPDGRVTTTSNHSGGIQGGISNGQPITFRVAFKPTATIALPQQTVGHGENTTLAAHGRHDPCLAPRAVAVVQAMTALTILDFLLLR